MTTDEAHSSDAADGTADADATAAPDHDVVVVGGGPTGAAAAVFTARDGLDTIVFDRGSAALDRCAYLENYLGFPGGIEISTFQELCQHQLAEAGARREAEMVVSVDPLDEDAEEAGPSADTANAVADEQDLLSYTGGPRFVVETQEGSRVTATHVIAAAWYDGSYLRGIDDEAMFSEQAHHGEVEERFDRGYADADGRTPIDGLYVAAPAGSRSEQAIVAAGNGAAVARSLLEDHRRAAGIPAGVAPVYDWRRRDDEFSGEWAERDRWREWFHNEVGDDHDRSADALERLREDYIDDAFATALTEAEVAERAPAGIEHLVDAIGQDRVLDVIDDDQLLDAVDDDRILDVVDDDRIRDRARDLSTPNNPSSD